MLSNKAAPQGMRLSAHAPTIFYHAASEQVRILLSKQEIILWMRAVGIFRLSQKLSPNQFYWATSFAKMIRKQMCVPCSTDKRGGGGDLILRSLFALSILFVLT